MERAWNNFANPTPVGPGNSPSDYEHNPWLLSQKTINGKTKQKEIPSCSPLTKLSSWCRKKLETCIFFNNANNDYL